MSTETRNRHIINYLDSAISTMEELSANPTSISPMHPARNPQHWTDMIEQLELIRTEMKMVSWKQLFSVPERRVIITVPDYAGSIHDRMSILERYLCANSRLDECVRLDPATLQPEKLYRIEYANEPTGVTLTISHRSHEPRLTVISEYNYHSLPAGSDDWQTTLTYYCSFIDEEPEFIKDDLMMESEVSTNDCN